MWPGYVGRSYPFDGTDPIAYADTGFLWDLARARGRTVKVYGEFAGMAILVVEDDAQNGVDHVDDHRTVALAVSPYVRRGAVDSTFYAQQSMVKTIELMPT
jgi:hypothetical protein